MRRAFVLGLLFSLLPLTLRPQASSGRTDAMLSMGIAQFRDGDFETAVFTLDSVVQKLLGQHDRPKELAKAYLYLGAAYIGLDC